MIETLAAHKVIFLLITAAAIAGGLYLRNRNAQAYDALGTPATVSPGSGGASDPTSFVLPSPVPPFGSSGAQPTPTTADSGGATTAFISPGEQVTTGPGAGPSVATPQYPDPSSAGAPGSPAYVAATTGLAVATVPSASGTGTTTLIGPDAKGAASPAKIAAAKVQATQQSEDYAHRFVEAAQGQYSAGL